MRRGADTTNRSMVRTAALVVSVVLVAQVVGGGGLGTALGGTTEARGERSQPSLLGRARVFLAAGDYRRAIDACQAQIDAAPSAEHYVYLTYVYHALRGYLDYLAEHDEWLKVGHVYLNLAAQDPFDLVDPPSTLPRMATEMIHEGIRQQSDVSAAMATRLSKSLTDRLWQQQAAWRQSHPDRWWQGVPEEWGW